MFEEFLNNKDSWLSGRGPSSEIIFSSRIRLARNFNDFPFPCRANSNQKEIILKKMQEIYSKVKGLKKAIFVSMEDLNNLERQFLLERHLISQEHMVSLKGKGLIVLADEKIALMINEEDHLRIQVMTSGFDLKLCWEVINDIDNELSKSIEFAFSSSMGYLTACPTNVGTALRASCMLHLPALVLTKRIAKVLELLAKISFTTRGLFGEGTQALGDFFQISNQASLGHSEAELIDNLSGVVNQVKEQEMDARDTLFRKHKNNLEDNIWRSLGILNNCRLISSKEALSHLSMLSLGLDLGIINSIKRELINSLFIAIQPAHLQKIEGKELKEGERDYTRAQILREKLSETNN
ncbi:MAG: protein arginine kinase [Candidatus Omnitrophota bacterium]|nr:protein arginine kinase [Candidatus Omnitrophota bacterium]